MLASTGAAQGAQPRQPYTERISGTLVTFEMLPVPAGNVQLRTTAGERTVNVPALWMAKTELTWDLYDVYVFGLDRTADAPATAADAVARPSKPYVLPGDAYGHQGYPALGMSFRAAQEFARWASAKTGHKYRLPTEAEWIHLCRAGKTEPGAASTADMGSGGSGGGGGGARGGRGSSTQTAGSALGDALRRVAWFADNANDQTHPVGALAPNALGAHDVLGNAAEWAVADGDSIVMGGGFSSNADAVHCTARRSQTPAWNVSDPQLPKSRWWLTDAFFVGLRLVREE